MFDPSKLIVLVYWDENIDGGEQIHVFNDFRRANEWVMMECRSFVDSHEDEKPTTTEELVLEFMRDGRVEFGDGSGISTIDLYASSLLTFHFGGEEE